MKLITVLLFVIIACSCINHQEKSLGTWKQLTIDIKDENQQTEEAVFTDFRFIKLETTEKSLLEGIQKVVWKEDRLFLLSSIGIGGNNVMAFDTTGHFLFKLKKGRGPGEVIFVSDININQQKEELWVLDLYQQVKIFNLEGKYLRSFSIKDPALYFAAEGSQTIFFDSDVDRKSDYYAWTLINGKKTETFFPKIKNLSSANLVHTYPFTCLGKDSVLVSDYFSDTIYCVSNRGKKIDIHYVMNYKGRSMNDPERIKYVKDRTNYREMLKIQNTVSGITDLVVSKQRLFFMLESDQHYYVVYDRVSDKPVLHSKLFKGLPNIYASVGHTSEHVLYAMTMPRLFRYFEENPSSESDPKAVQRLRQICVDEDDNPVIFLCRL